MKRGGLFLIAIITAAATIISLNAVFGRNFNENYRGRYGWHHHCYNYNDDHNRNNKQDTERKQQQDSATGKY